MADPVLRVTSGDQHFDFAGLMAHEMVQVQKWTGIEKRREFHKAIRDEVPSAVLAAFTLVEWRAAGTDDPPRWGSAKVDLDALAWSWHVDGRAVDMVVETDDDGRKLLAVLDERGNPKRDGDGFVEPTGDPDERVGVVPILDDEGNTQWRYADTGEDIRPTEPPATRGSTGSTTTAKPSGDGSESPSRDLTDVSV